MKLTLIIDLDNAAYRHHDGSLDFSQISESLYEVMTEVDGGATDFSIRDGNGNRVGQLRIAEHNYQPGLLEALEIMDANYRRDAKADPSLGGSPHVQHALELSAAAIATAKAKKGK